MKKKNKKWIKCHRILPEVSFYNEKNICKSCYKRWIRRKIRIEKGAPIKTVGELIRELTSLPYDSKIALCTDIDMYQPITVEFIREIYKGNKKYDTDKYNNVVVIVWIVPKKE